MAVSGCCYWHGLIFRVAAEMRVIMCGYRVILRWELLEMSRKRNILGRCRFRLCLYRDVKFYIYKMCLKLLTKGSKNIKNKEPGHKTIDRRPVSSL